MPALRQCPNLFKKICRTFFVGRHKTGPCGRRTWLEAIISLRNLNYMVFSKPAKFLVFSFTVMFNILCASAQFYAPWCDYYFMRVSAILCQGNFRHWQASTPIGVVLKRRGRLRACSQRLPRRFNTIAPLGAEACQ